MIGPSLQKAIVGALKAADIAGDRIYDSVPEGALFPYVAIGDEQANDNGDQCAEMYDVFADIHVWSRSVGKTEAKTIGEAIREALIPSLTIDDYGLVLSEPQSSRFLLDPDGKTTHGILTFRFLVQPD